ncbi:MAG: hypothetical protein L6R40_004328 [Gallowayella cf. fulva]|nr:MAG: hypothetical protein L6R40_004328 [Xanthomendoza cf. fulva]
MINAVLVFNNSGQPRLTKFYTQLDTSVQQRLISEIFTLVSNRPASACNFLPLPPLLAPPPSASSSSEHTSHSDTPTSITYRHYATLYFILISTSTESPLALLDLIQVFVESLDRLFNNVCELDLIFNFEAMHACLAEMVVGGVVVETRVQEIVKGVRESGRGSVRGKEQVSEGRLALAASLVMARVPLRIVRRVGSSASRGKGFPSTLNEATSSSRPQRPINDGPATLQGEDAKLRSVDPDETFPGLNAQAAERASAYFKGSQDGYKREYADCRLEMLKLAWPSPRANQVDAGTQQGSRGATTDQYNTGHGPRMPTLDDKFGSSKPTALGGAQQQLAFSTPVQRPNPVISHVEPGRGKSGHRVRYGASPFQEIRPVHVASNVTIIVQTIRSWIEIVDLADDYRIIDSRRRSEYRLGINLLKNAWKASRHTSLFSVLKIKSPVKINPYSPFKPQPSMAFSTLSQRPTPARVAPSTPENLSVDQYHRLADEYIDNLVAHLEELQEERRDVDCEYSAGVLNLDFPPAGTYVLNKQPPNKQIWLSSPISGPKRYDYVVTPLSSSSSPEPEETRTGGDGASRSGVGIGRQEGKGQWMYLRDGSTLSGLLKEELGVQMEEEEEV